MVWLSFEISNDYEMNAFKKWLQSKNALECCSNCACISTDVTAEKLKIELDKLNIFNKNVGNRLYLIFKKSDGTYAGRFLYGGRINKPWEWMSL